MKTTAASIAYLSLPKQNGLARGIREYFILMKPRVMMLAVFTALVGMMIAPVHPDVVSGIIGMFAIASGAGAAGALNMWYDADIDAVMSRTAMRPIPRGRISRGGALIFGLALAGSSVVALAMARNLVSAGLLAFAIFFYVAVYTAWLKRLTPQNIVIGGAAGALPPVIGWAAATGSIGLEPLVLFSIIFLWTPPHFWALSLNRVDEYRRAGVPMLPVAAGRETTTRQILVYSVLLFATSFLPWLLGYAGTIYAVIALAYGAIFVVYALRLLRSKDTDRKAPQHLFAFSIPYLFLLFAALLAGDRSAQMPFLPARVASTFADAAAIEHLSHDLRTALCSVRVITREL